MPEPVPVFLATIDARGRLTYEQPMAFGRWLGLLREQRVEVVVRKRRAQRSGQQNRAYFGLCVSIFAAHCGYSREEMHEALAWKFLSRDEAGDPLPRRRSTTSLTVAEFEDYVRQIRQLAAEMGCDIPEPNEVPS